MSGNLLTVSFDHKEENSKQQEGWIRNEYVQRSFNRSFNLDDSVDADKISATYTDGVLHLSLLKNEKEKKLSRNIEIR